MTFLRQVRAELRKLCAPSTLVLLVIFAVLVWQDASTTAQFADRQTPVAVAVTLDLQRQLGETCPSGLTSVANGVDCDILRQDVQLNQHFGTNGLALGSVAASLDTFPGLVKFTSHQMVTGLGWLLLALLTALHVTREEYVGSAGHSVLRAGRFRYLIAKVISLLVSAFAIIVVTSTALFALRSTLATEIGAPRASIGPGGAFAQPEVPVTASTDWTAWGAAAGDLLRCLPVFAVIIVAFVGIASLLRRTTVAAGVLVGVAVAMIAASHSSAAARWLPVAKLSQALGLNEVPPGVRDARVWNLAGRAPDIYSLPPESTATWLPLVLWSLAFLVIAVGAARLFIQRVRIG